MPHVEVQVVGLGAGGVVEHVDVEIDGRGEHPEPLDARLLLGLAERRPRARLPSPSACPPGCSHRCTLAWNSSSTWRVLGSTTAAEPVRWP